MPVLVFANKQDLLNAMDAGELMSELELTAIKDRWVHVHACSAKTGDGLQEGMERLMAHKQKAEPKA